MCCVGRSLSFPFVLSPFPFPHPFFPLSFPFPSFLSTFFLPLFFLFPYTFLFVFPSPSSFPFLFPFPLPFLLPFTLLHQNFSFPSSSPFHPLPLPFPLSLLFLFPLSSPSDGTDGGESRREKSIFCEALKKQENRGGSEVSCCTGGGVL